MGRICTIVAMVYFFGGVAVWIQFASTNPDGLANLGLVLYVLPITLVGLAITALTGVTEFILIPDGFGYLTSHAIFFFPSLLAVTAAIAWCPPKVLAAWRARHSARVVL